MVFQDGRQFVGEFSITHRETHKFDYYQVPESGQCPFSKESYVFFGSISQNGVPDPSGLQTWACEKSLKESCTVDVDRTFTEYNAGENFLKCFLPCIMTPFFAIYIFLFIAPFVIFRVPVMAAATYPFSVLWMTGLTFMLVGLEFKKKFLTMS